MSWSVFAEFNIFHLEHVKHEEDEYFNAIRGARVSALGIATSLQYVLHLFAEGYNALVLLHWFHSRMISPLADL